MPSIQTSLWLVFGGIVFVALFVDLFIKNGRKHTHIISLKEATRWTMLWIGLAAAFAGAIYLGLGREKAFEFLAGYLIEESLSVDNMLVFVLIFNYFHVPRLYHPRVLKYGILGAVLMRFIIIFTGVALLNRFHWVFYIFGLLLLATAAKMVFENDKEPQAPSNPLLKLLRRFIPVTHEFHEEQFFVRKPTGLMATPLVATLLAVEASDLVFAVDSIPAVLAISTDPFIVFTSNVFAILGLRSLYFMISEFMGLFRFLKYGLAVVLSFVGLKMLLMNFYKIPTSLSLLIVLCVLGISILVSVLVKEKPRPLPSS